MNTLETARFWRSWGAAPIPIQHQDKRPEVSWKDYQTTLPSDNQLEVWFGNGHESNIAIVTGHQGLTVIDFDDETAWQQWVQFGKKRAKANNIRRFTYRVETAKGRHIYVRLPEATKSRPLLKPDGSRVGIDIKSRGGYVLTPPSIHPSGTSYRATNPGALVWKVSALSEILPADMLTQVDFVPPAVQRPAPVDIWDQAMNPGISVGNGTVDRIKAHYKLEDILPALERTGTDFYLTRCPLHDDHNPSMWVKSDEQICGCYAGCTIKPLDFINLYSRVHDLTNREAIIELARGL